ncbi:MAG: hypothetical protein E6K18_03665 [Methanobacteriota archaeon]|nr:MAG: hypothetical protein E6K18_03665 [Euryarchaeota archaeon]
MARRIVKPDGTFCSSCGNAVDASAGICYTCGQPFEGAAAGAACPNCGRAVEATEAICPVCGTDLPRAPTGPIPADPPGNQKNLVEEIQAFRGERRENPGGAAADPNGPPETEQSLLAELESLWKLAEPFEQVVLARRKRLEQMDRLIAAARRRVRELGDSGIPAEVREREELKRQVQEVLLEREEILKIEYGIAEMERIYRNIITTQQQELRSKEDALKARLEGFRKEIGMRDAERQAIADREQELERRERALQEKLAKLEDRTSAPAAVTPPPNPVGEGEAVTREQWLAAQRDIQDALLKLRGTAEGEIILPTAEGLRDLRMRVTELEELLEKNAEEQGRLEAEVAELRKWDPTLREVLAEIDDLLGKLPDADIKKFARSESFKKYSELMERLGL